MKCTLGLASPDVEQTKEGSRCDNDSLVLNTDPGLINCCAISYVHIQFHSGSSFIANSYLPHCCVFIV
jgi:hypothetical protein